MMKLRELLQRIDAESTVTRPRPSRKRRIAGWAAGIGMAAFLFFSGHYLARREIRKELSYVHNDIGILYKIHNEPNKAAYQYQRAIELNGRNEYVYHNLGALYLDIGSDYKKAEEYLKKAIAIRPDYAPSHEALAEAERNLRPAGNH